eukprot:TRINITY_DN51011_c0_g1_i1.p1 TRINITY_DN51011_c0_g1~~TRINITY_DN51011_c0_g1_i1.p1  ORF type:complete len:548 (+),score=170.79 TRINITY_DN51011_c0_g1_i1:74-1645(+)
MPQGGARAPRWLRLAGALALGVVAALVVDRWAESSGASQGSSAAPRSAPRSAAASRGGGGSRGARAAGAASRAAAARPNEEEDDGPETPAPPQPPCALGFTLEEGAWYEGDRLPPHPITKTAEQCGKVCAEEMQCRYFTWRISDGACHRGVGKRGLRHTDGGKKSHHFSGQCAAAPDASGGPTALTTAGKACGSLQRSAALHKWWSPSAPAPPEPPGVGPPRLCPAGGGGSDGGAPAVPPPPPKTGADAPAAVVGRDKGWVKGQLTAEHVSSLRRRGVLGQWYIDHTTKVAACLVPKAGCTGWKAWLLHMSGDPRMGQGNVHNRSRYRGPRLIDANTLSDRQMLSILNDGTYFKFAVVRNPFTRSLATYLERFYQCHTRRTLGDCIGWGRALVGNMDTRNMRTFSPSFSEYLSLQHRQLRAHPTFNYMSAHWLASAITCGLDEIPYDFVVRLERPKDAELVYSLAGHKNVFGRAVGGHSQGTTAKLTRYYSTQAALALAQQVYQHDTDVLGYKHQGVVPEPLG